MRVLLIEEDSQQGKALRANLEQQGKAVEWLQNAADAERAMSDDYAAVVLPATLGNQDGVTLLRKLRGGRQHPPAIFVMTQADLAQRMAGLGNGDDFIVAPIDTQELDARLRLLVRRADHRGDPAGQLKLDAAARTVLLDDKRIELTVREFSILTYLLEYRGQVISKQQLQTILYSGNDEIESNTVEVHVHHLRRKLGRQLIKTMHGIGYMLDGRP